MAFNWSHLKFIGKVKTSSWKIWPKGNLIAKRFGQPNYHLFEIYILLNRKGNRGWRMNYIRPQKEKKNVQKEHDRRKKKFDQKFKSFNLENFGPMAIWVEIVGKHILLHFGCQKTSKREEKKARELFHTILHLSSWKVKISG